MGARAAGMELVRGPRHRAQMALLRIRDGTGPKFSRSRRRSHLRFLAPAYRIGSWVSALPDAARECSGALKSDGRRDDVVMGDRDPGRSAAVAAGQGAALTDAALAGISHLGGDEQAMDNGNAPEDKARSGPTDGGEPTIGRA